MCGKELTTTADDGAGQQAALLNAVLEAAPDAALLITSAMRIAACNRRSDEAFSKDGETLNGRRLSEVVRDAGLHAAARLAIDGRRSSLRVDVPGPEKRSFDVHLSPVKLAGESCAIAMFYNVTHSERVDRIRKEFLSNISHELRTPLTSILAFVETLEDGAVDDKENNRRFLQVIRRNAERMHALIADILELSLIESGNVSVVIGSVELAPLVADIFASLSAQAAARSVELKNGVPPGTVVRADPGRLEQMLTNLVENAIKFNNPNGSVTVNYADKGDRNVICVSDEGDGIVPDHLERIFERFYRADRARSSDGTGLGLAIVKHLARLHGGEVTAASTLGTGSTFSIELPARDRSTL